MSFFARCSKMMEGFDLSIAIRKSGEHLTVILVPKLTGEKDFDLPALSLTGTPEELENGFFQKIHEAMQGAKETIQSIASFKAQLKALEDQEREKLKKKTAPKEAPKDTKKPEKKEDAGLFTTCETDNSDNLEDDDDIETA